MLESQGFISFVKWISSEMSEIKANIVSINSSALLPLSGAMYYYCKTFEVLRTLNLLKTACLATLFPFYFN